MSRHLRWLVCQFFLLLHFFTPSKQFFPFCLGLFWINCCLACDPLTVLHLNHGCCQLGPFRWRTFDHRRKDPCERQSSPRRGLAYICATGRDHSTPLWYARTGFPNLVGFPNQSINRGIWWFDYRLSLGKKQILERMSHIILYDWPWLPWLDLAAGRKVLLRHQLNNRNEVSHRNELKKTLVEYGFAKGVFCLNELVVAGYMFFAREWLNYPSWVGNMLVAFCGPGSGFSLGYCSPPGWPCFWRSICWWKWKPGILNDDFSYPHRSPLRGCWWMASWSCEWKIIGSSGRKGAIDIQQSVSRSSNIGSCSVWNYLESLQLAYASNFWPVKEILSTIPGPPMQLKHGWLQKLLPCSGEEWVLRYSSWKERGWGR